MNSFLSGVLLFTLVAPPAVSPAEAVAGSHGLKAGDNGAALPYKSKHARTASEAGAQAASPQPRQVSQAEQEVRRLEREWLDAYERRDAEAMNRIVADDFTITFPNGGMQTKEQVISSLKGAAGPSPKFYTEDVRSRAYGDTVILIGRVVAEWEQAGKKVREQFRYTDTYVRRQGRWQVVASHLSNVPAVNR